MRRSRELGAWSFAVVVAALAGACSLPRSVTSSFDGSGIDAFAMGDDAGPLDDAYTPGDDAWTGIDAYIPGNDAFVPPNDAFVPPDDAFTPPGDAGPPGCDATFASMATSYEFCSTDGTGACTFYLQLGTGTDCNNVCGRTGHTCLAAIENDTTNHCTSSGGAQMCNHNMTDAICTCSWP